MKKNIGFADRIVRAVLALGIGVLYFTDTISGTTAVVAGIVAVVLLLTSLIGVCPLYSLLGLSTLNPKKDNSPYRG